MMSCGMSSKYGSSLLLKTADFSIQGVTVSVRCENPLSRTGERVLREGLFCGLFKCPQHGVAARYRGVEGLLGGFLTAKRSFHLFAPDVTHLHHVAEAQAARILGRLLVGKLLQWRFRHRILPVEAVRLGLFI